MFLKKLVVSVAYYSYTIPCLRDTVYYFDFKKQIYFKKENVEKRV